MAACRAVSGKPAAANICAMCVTAAIWGGRAGGSGRWIPGRARLADGRRGVRRRRCWTRNRRRRQGRAGQPARTGASRFWQAAGTLREPHGGLLERDLPNALPGRLPYPSRPLRVYWGAAFHLRAAMDPAAMRRRRGVRHRASCPVSPAICSSGAGQGLPTHSQRKLALND